MSDIEENSQILKRTPLYEKHVAVGARMVPFGGWEMPVQYSDGIIHEVRQVRNDVGIFDVSHMARLVFHTSTDSSTSRRTVESGFEERGAADFLDTVLSVRASELRDMQARYHVICNELGGIIDDAIVYKINDESFSLDTLSDNTCAYGKSSTSYLLVVNAGNAETDIGWLEQRLDVFDNEHVKLEDKSVSSAMIAVQGPRAVDVVDSLSNGKARAIRRFRAGALQIDDIKALAVRTGYTGEDGFELICHESSSAKLWQTLIDVGATPCGLGARDVLRLEAGLMLHGSDMSVENNPYEAGLSWTIVNDDPRYVAEKPLRRIRKNGTENRITGFIIEGRGIARQGQAILHEGENVGTVTSGTFSPTLDKAIGMGYVPTALAEPNTSLTIDIRGRLVEAETVAMPFYRRG